MVLALILPLSLDVYSSLPCPLPHRDGNGELDFKEVFKCLNECIPNMTEEQAKETIREIDANHDGKVQYEEFVACLKNRPAKIRGGLAGGSSRRLLKTNGAI